jgi:hypothetical protein
MANSLFRSTGTLHLAAENVYFQIMEGTKTQRGGKKGKSNKVVRCFCYDVIQSSPIITGSYLQTVYFFQHKLLRKKGSFLSVYIKSVSTTPTTLQTDVQRILNQCCE